MRARDIVVLATIATIGSVVVRHLRHAGGGHDVAGGIVMNDAGVYDVLTGVVLGSFFDGIATDVARALPSGARVLEVGCGPGHLSLRLARAGFELTGLDLDPSMIARARVKLAGSADMPRASFVVGDVAALPFPDASFDAVVSTLSMHHWDDPHAGLAEISRVLRPGARALVWDLRPGTRPHPFAPRHEHGGQALDHVAGLRPVRATPWPWPWRITLVERTELVRA